VDDSAAKPQGVVGSTTSKKKFDFDLYAEPRISAMYATCAIVELVEHGVGFVYLDNTRFGVAGDDVGFVSLNAPTMAPLMSEARCSPE
jgi:hypothetical protein